MEIPTNIAKMAARDKVAVKRYKVIYELLDDAKAEMAKLLDAEVVEEETGEMKIKGVFRTEPSAIIAGGEILNGRVSAGMLGRVMHEKEQIGEIEVESVQREKIAANELVAGETGGIAFKLSKRLTIEVGDRVEFFTRELKQKKL